MIFNKYIPFIGYIAAITSSMYADDCVTFFILVLSIVSIFLLNLIVLYVFPKKSELIKEEMKQAVKEKLVGEESLVDLTSDFRLTLYKPRKRIIGHRLVCYERIGNEDTDEARRRIRKRGRSFKINEAKIGEYWVAKDLLDDKELQYLPTENREKWHRKVGFNSKKKVKHMAKHLFFYRIEYGQDKIAVLCLDVFDNPDCDGKKINKIWTRLSKIAIFLAKSVASSEFERGHYKFNGGSDE